MFWLFLILYVLVASGAIFGLLVAADKWTELDSTVGYVLCGIFWPVAALPAAAYIAAAWYAQREDRQDG
jgi:ABC-type multidrug transport system permease subunit